jgi:hypothetical protein
LGDGRERDAVTARPISARTAVGTSALNSNPIEHGNIQVFEPGGQSRHRAMGCATTICECAITAASVSIVGQSLPGFMGPLAVLTVVFGF